MLKQPLHRIFHSFGILAILAATTFLVYWGLFRNDFIGYDDDVYIFSNSHVISGLKHDNVKWAFSTLEQANWHPLTWISHMLDVQMFGLSASGHHFIGLCLHVLNVLILFLLLKRFTGAVAKSALVAVLFSLHPLHVESVAWAAERKDLLSTLFGLITLYLYGVYAENGRTVTYCLALLTFICGLLAKPMLVSIPIVMMLFDVWPLRRVLEHQTLQDGGWKIVMRKWFRSGFWKEKIPFLVLAFISCVITVYAQKTGKALSTFASTPLELRLENAAVSYVVYMLKTVWPQDLSVFYPFPSHIPAWQSLSSVLILSAITYMVFKKFSRYPYFAVGWLWFIFSLFPVIGIIKVGLQAMADRYTYIPLTGLFIMVVWGADDLAMKNARCRKFLPVMALGVLTVFAFVTRQQVTYWRDTGTLFTHAMAATGDNFIAHVYLGTELEKEGKNVEALAHYDEAIRLAPRDDFAKTRKAEIFKYLGKIDDAINLFEEISRINPRSDSARVNLGIALAMRNRFPESINQFNAALTTNPASASAHYNLGLVYDRLEDFERAQRHFRSAIQLSPGQCEYYNNLGVVLAKLGKYDEAIEQFSVSLRVKPDFQDARTNLKAAEERRHHN